MFENKFKEMTDEKARLTEQLHQVEEDAITDVKRQKQLNDILKAIDIDVVELTEFDDTFIGGFSKVGDIPNLYRNRLCFIV